MTERIPEPPAAPHGVLALGKKDSSLDKADLSKAGAKVEWTGSAGPFARPTAGRR
ncbi:hypothetical protein [Streptomyces sp. AM 2-1-1]|uniref:hypothetical protein n=1 Tax=Streptomyces sp. AM 2-1-1 TaxID=3028709 RepID=UPI0023B8863E|nr:hypothetical protein [Streptomyces sp. AM 2-1-1]WEH43477.1 hypothetical protein PZB77_30515 [Streptomyces sp. AM 2-1-1]